MEAHLYLEAKIEMIGSATDFTYKWCVNMGLDVGKAAQLTLAVDEILTDIILHAYSDTSGYVEIWYQYSFSELEIIVQETGEPFDPEQHAYSPEKAISRGDFEGAGREIARKMTDHFIFLNRGKDGKEFRLVKKLDKSHIRDLIKEETTEGRENGVADTYLLTPATSEDAEDIARLIYQCYDYSYGKEDLYFPKRIEMAIRHGYKFGTIVRTSRGGPAGYFAVIRNSDSLIGEVGEAVVAPPHRKRGLMKRMLNKLIEMSRQKGLLGLYGMALTVHTISQKANEKFNFKSTALLLARSSRSIYKGIREDYPQPISMVMDFLPLTKKWNTPVFLPRSYSDIMKELYIQFENHPGFKDLPDQIEKADISTELSLEIYYEANSALIIVRKLGNTFEGSCLSMFRSLEELKLTSIYIDIPLNHPGVDPSVEWLRENGFIFAGLMPFFHKERDYVRMQKINTELDFALIETHSEMAGKLKETISSEFHALHKG